MSDSKVKSDEEYDVLIVGGGLVGGSLACALSSLDLKIGVLEAERLSSEEQPSFDERTVALTYGSRRIFEGIGLWDDIEARGVAPILRIHVSDRGHGGFARMSCQDVGTEALGYVVPTRSIGATLTQFMTTATGITHLCPARVTGFVVGPQQVQVQFELNDAKSQATSRLLIIADGGRSGLREMAGIHAATRVYPQQALVSLVATELDHAGTAFERFRPAGPLALLPMTDGRCALVWTLRKQDVDERMQQSDEEFLAALQQEFGDRLGQFTRVGRRVVYPLSLSRVSDPVRPRVVVMGNAAHTVHPVAGQGFNLGLRDVAVLADVLNQAVTDRQDPGEPAILRRYSAWRRRDSFAVSHFTDGLMRVFANDFFPLTVSRNLGLFVVDLFPSIKRGLLRRTMGLTGRLPRLALGLSLSGAAQGQR